MSDGLWRTVAEVKKTGELKEGVIYNWFDALEAHGLARRNPGKQHGLIMLSPRAVEFLKWRSPRKGNPTAYGDDWGEGDDLTRRTKAVAQWMEMTRVAS